ncbi:hypothetical protein [Phenylobacterium kunshanense]|uniref:hypothetical protein n=1 Tax=Phenylobacterium kunshanense TaxID=1445034 RepID=UPI00105789E4|nr:hypothetical protein [Phenylobacterium kunshanense]
MTHTGAIARGLAYAPTPPREPVRAPEPAQAGRDPVSLFKLSSQERIRAETAMIVERTLQDLAADNQRRAEIRATGAFLDIRV